MKLISSCRLARVLLVTPLIFAYGIGSTWAAPNDSDYKPPSPPSQTVRTDTLPARRDRPIAAYQPDILVVSTSKGADQEEYMKAINELNGKVINKVNVAGEDYLVIQTERGKLDQTEKKLSKDKNFSSFERNMYYSFEGFVNGFSPWYKQINDPGFDYMWYLFPMNMYQAWGRLIKENRHTGYWLNVAVIDSGVDTHSVELGPRSYVGGRGYIVSGNGGCKAGDPVDTVGHGTMVSSVIAATAGNGVGAAGLSFKSTILPIKLEELTTLTIARGIDIARGMGVKVVNLSINGTPPNTISAVQTNSILDKAIKAYSRNGLIFLAAGNDGMQDDSSHRDDLIVVSALDKENWLMDPHLARFSNYGPPVWFVAPGVEIIALSSDRKLHFVSGTSFSCPLVAAWAAMGWSQRPSLTPTEMKVLLKRSAERIYDGNGILWPRWSPKWGYGLPDGIQLINNILGPTR